MATSATTSGSAPSDAGAPARAGVVLATLILVAAVANVNLSVANVALPDIDAAFDASQTAINLVAVGFSLGLAATVLYLGAVGDRYGRKAMLLTGMALSIPASLLAAYAPSVEVLAVVRVIGGVAAGMAYPTTLSLITALWRGHPRTRAIALWSGLGGAVTALGPLAGGVVLASFWWGSAFLLTLPVAVVAIVAAWRVVPAHVHEGDEPVDHLGGVLSVVAVAGIVLGIHFVGTPGATTQTLVLAGVGAVFTAGFFLRQRRAASPLFDLHVAGRRTFWVAAVAGIVVFGSLMAAIFVGQQFMQNVLGYSALASGAAILPGVVGLIVAAPVSAGIVQARGSRVALLVGDLLCVAGFAVMLVVWTESSSYWSVGAAYALVGLGVGLAGPPASRSLTSSVPVDKAGMASGTADLQRDLGGAVFQSILGVLLAAGYATAFSGAIAALPSDQSSQISDDVVTQLRQSFGGADQVAEQYPQYADQIVDAARASFLQGSNWAYLAGMVACALGALLVAVAYPGRAREEELLAAFHAEDTAPAGI